MSLTAPVDFRLVVDAFNQSGYPRKNFGCSFNRNSANFEANTSLSLEDVQWGDKSIEVPDLAHSKTVEVNTVDNNVVTNVMASANSVPGSNVNIVSGYLTGLSSLTTKARMQMPDKLGGHIMYLDLSKKEQRVSMPSESAQNLQKSVRGSGKVTVKSVPKVYQGSFHATAIVTGIVTFSGEGEFQVPVELMAKAANDSGLLPSPFNYDYNRKALCWKVSGNMDLLVENINFVQ